MQAIENAQASLGKVRDTRASLPSAASGVAMSAGASKAMAEITASLDSATNAVGLAVADLAAGDAVGSKGERKASVQRAEGRLREADQKRDAVARQLVDAQTSLASEPGAGELLGAANAVLTGLGKATEAAGVAAKQSDQRAQPLSRRLRHGVLIVLIAVLAVGAWYASGGPEVEALQSALFAWAIIVATLLFVTYRDADNGVFGPIIGADKRFSTSRAQIGLWTIAFGFATSYLVGRVLFDGASIEAVLQNDRVGEYLLLLGGPFAAGVLAKLTVSWKVDNGSIQKTEAAAPSAGQLFQDDSGNVDLVDSQYFMFNLIAMGYFLVNFAQTAELPTMPDFLLGLTSAAALTYTANKAAESNAPQITAISPRTCRAGQRIRVAGQNFYAGVDDPSIADVAVFIEGVASELRPIPGSSTKKELSIDVPLSVTAGSKGVTVRTAANVTSSAFVIDVVEDAPELFGLKGPAVAGSDAVASGRNLRSPGSTESPEAVGVKVGGFAEPGRATDTELTFRIPANIERDADVDVSVTRAGSTSSSIRVHTAP
jgi:hypothetical protein